MRDFLFLLYDRSLDDCVIRTKPADDCVMRAKPVLRRLEQSPLAAGDTVSKERSDVAEASKVSLADRLGSLFMYL